MDILEEDPGLKVIHNPLLLRLIISNLRSNEILPLRLVFHKWRNLIDSELSRQLLVVFSSESNVETGFKYFKDLKISNVSFTSSTSESWEEENELLENILENGSHIRKLRLCYISLITQEGFSLFEKIFRLPELRSLELKFPKINASMIQNLHRQMGNVQSLREFKIQIPTLFGDGFVPELLGMFPNITTNFQNVKMDVELLKLIRMGRFPGNFEKFEINAQGIIKEYFHIILTEMNQLPKGRLEIKRLIIWDINGLSNEGLKCLREIISKLENSLEILELHCNYWRERREKRTMTIPPLKNLRKLTLGIPYVPLDGGRHSKAFRGEPDFIWNLGKSMAKDFPNLEYFMAEQIIKQRFSFAFYPRAWEIWESFIPTTKEQNENERLKFLKFVDLAISECWIGAGAGRAWGRETAEVYSRIYGNAGGGSMKLFLKWFGIYDS